MLDLSPLKLLIIVAVILLVMGPDKLPEVAHKLGAAWRSLKKLQQRVESEIREAIPDLPSTNDIARIARNPVNLLNQLADRVEAKESGTAQEASPAAPENGPPEVAPLLTTPTQTPRRLVPEAPPSSPDPSLN